MTILTVGSSASWQLAMLNLYRSTEDGSKDSFAEGTSHGIEEGIEGSSRGYPGAQGQCEAAEQSVRGYGEEQKEIDYTRLLRAGTVYLGGPCQRGHEGFCYKSDASCVRCKREAAREQVRQGKRLRRSREL